MLNSIANADYEQLLLVFLAISPVVMIISPVIWQMRISRWSRVDIMSPVFIALGTVFIGTTLRTWFLMFDPEAPRRMIQILGPYKPEDVLFNGLIVINLGIAAWIIGYCLPLKFNGKMRRTFSMPTKINAVIAIAAVFGLILNLNYLFQIDFFRNLTDLGLSAKRFFVVGDQNIEVTQKNANTTTYQYLKIGSDLLFACVAVYSCYIFSLLRKKRVPSSSFASNFSFSNVQHCFNLLVLLCLATMIPLIASVRGEIIYLVIAVILAWHYIFHRFRLRYLLATFVVAMLLLTQLEILRQQSRLGDAADEFSISRVMHTLVYTAHFVGVGKTSAIVEHFPEENDYFYGKSYLTIFIAPIPRVFWPEKPVVRIGRFVGGEVMERRSNSGVVPGIIGEAYINFSLPGVISVLFLFGIFCNTTYRWMLVNRQSQPLVVGLYALTWIFMMDMFTSDFTGSTVRFLRVALPFAVLVYFIYGSRKLFSMFQQNKERRVISP